MKKGWKIFWTVCAVLAAVGFLTTTVGAVLGGFMMISTVDETGPIRNWLDIFGRNEPYEITSDDNNFAASYEIGATDVDLITGYTEVSMNLSDPGVSIIPSGGIEIVVDKSQLREDISECSVGKMGIMFEKTTEKGHSNIYFK